MTKNMENLKKAEKMDKKQKIFIISVCVIIAIIIVCLIVYIVTKNEEKNVNENRLANMYERMMMLQEDMIKLQNRVVDMQFQQLSGKRLAVYSRRMREDIIDCYKNGYSTRVISKMFGISINRVIDILSIELFV